MGWEGSRERLGHVRPQPLLRTQSTGLREAPAQFCNISRVWGRSSSSTRALKILVVLWHLPSYQPELLSCDSQLKTTF